MTVTWMSPEKAADVLGISYSTVQRRIKKGALESRCTSDDRQEVLVNDPNPDDSQVTGNKQMQIMAVNAGMANRLAERAEKEIGRMETELTRARRIGLVAWCLTAALGAAVMAGGGYGIYRSTRAIASADMKADTSTVRAQITEAQLRETKQQLQTELADARAQVNVAQAQAQNAAGRAEQLEADLDTVRSQLKASEARTEALKGKLAHRTWLEQLFAPTTRPSQ